MKITRCSGADVHFFDGDKYSVCPVCGKPSAENTGAVAPTPVAANPVVQENKTVNEAKHKGGLFGFGKKNKDKQKVNENTVNQPVSIVDDSCGTIAMTEVLNEQTYQDNVVEPQPVPQSVQQPAPQPMPQSVPQPTPQPMEQPVYTSSVPSGNTTISQMVPPVPPMPQAPVQNRSFEYDSAKTVGVYADVSSEPVVGWLICVKGESVGESFNLKAGKNSIGRGAGMDVMLAQERSVSRDKHAIITYEPKKRIFLIQPGDSSGLVYLNDELLMSFSQLSAYDTIQLGDAIFKFLPFCGEAFAWEDYLDN